MGGVVLLVALAGLLYCMRVRLKQQQSRHEQSEWRKNELPADSYLSELQDDTAPRVAELDWARRSELPGGVSVVNEVEAPFRRI